MSVDTQLITKMDCVDTQRAWWKGGCFGLVLALLAGSQAIAETQDGPERPLPNKRVLLVTGIDYPGHHWPQTAPELRQLLENDPRLIVRTTEEPESLSTLRVEDWDAIVLHFMNWRSQRRERLPGAISRISCARGKDWSWSILRAEPGRTGLSSGS